MLLLFGLCSFAGSPVMDGAVRSVQAKDTRAADWSESWKPGQFGEGATDDNGWLTVDAGP